MNNLNLNQWIDYYTNQIPDPFIHNGKIRLHQSYRNGHPDGWIFEREHWNQYYKTGKGRKQFVEEMMNQDSWLHRNGVWKKISYTKKYYQTNYLFAPLCSKCETIKILEYSIWGQLNPLPEPDLICVKCQREN